MGKSFWLAFGQGKNPGVTSYYIHIYPLKATLVTITLGKLDTQSYNLAKNELKTIEVKSQVETHTSLMNFFPDADLFERIREDGILVESQEDIKVKAQLFENNRNASTLIFPESKLGVRYLVGNIKSSITPRTPNYFSILATDDNTEIVINPQSEDYFNRFNKQIKLLLNKGEIFDFISADDEDVSGSLITANKKIAVFAGIQDIRVGCRVPNTLETLYKQQVPYRYWGKEYIAIPTFRKEDVLLANDIFKIFSDQNQAVVKIINPSTSQQREIILNAKNGYIYEFESKDPVIIQSDVPVMFSQFIKTSNCYGFVDGDTEMIMIPPTYQFVNKALVSLLDMNQSYSKINNHFLNLIIEKKNSDTFRINNQEISQALFLPLNEKYLYLHALNLNTFSSLDTDTFFLQADTGFLPLLYGVGSGESYANYENQELTTHKQFLVLKNAKGELKPLQHICNSDLEINQGFKPYLISNARVNGISWKFDSMANFLNQSVFTATKAEENHGFYQYDLSFILPYLQQGFNNALTLNVFSHKDKRNVLSETYTNVLNIKIGLTSVTADLQYVLNNQSLIATSTSQSSHGIETLTWELRELEAFSLNKTDTKFGQYHQPTLKYGFNILTLTAADTWGCVDIATKSFFVQENNINYTIRLKDKDENLYKKNAVVCKNQLTYLEIFLDKIQISTLSSFTYQISPSLFSSTLLQPETVQKDSYHYRLLLIEGKNMRQGLNTFSAQVTILPSNIVQKMNFSFYLNPTHQASIVIDSKPCTNQAIIATGVLENFHSNHTQSWYLNGKAIENNETLLINELESGTYYIDLLVVDENLCQTDMMTVVVIPSISYHFTHTLQNSASKEIKYSPVLCFGESAKLLLTVDYQVCQPIFSYTLSPKILRKNILNIVTKTSNQLFYELDLYNLQAGENTLTLYSQNIIGGIKEDQYNYPLFKNPFNEQALFSHQVNACNEYIIMAENISIGFQEQYFNTWTLNAETKLYNTTEYLQKTISIGSYLMGLEIRDIYGCKDKIEKTLIVVEETLSYTSSLFYDPDFLIPIKDNFHCFQQPLYAKVMVTYNSCLPLSISYHINNSKEVQGNLVYTSTSEAVFLLPIYNNLIFNGINTVTYNIHYPSMETKGIVITFTTNNVVLDTKMDINFQECTTDSSLIATDTSTGFDTVFTRTWILDGNPYSDAESIYLNTQTEGYHKLALNILDNKLCSDTQIFEYFIKDTACTPTFILYGEQGREKKDYNQLCYNESFTLQVALDYFDCLPVNIYYSTNGSTEEIAHLFQNDAVEKQARYLLTFQEYMINPVNDIKIRVVFQQTEKNFEWKFYRNQHAESLVLSYTLNSCKDFPLIAEAKVSNIVTDSIYVDWQYNGDNINSNQLSISIIDWQEQDLKLKVYLQDKHLCSLSQTIETFVDISQLTITAKLLHADDKRERTHKVICYSETLALALNFQYAPCVPLDISYRINDQTIVDLPVQSHSFSASYLVQYAAHKLNIGLNTMVVSYSFPNRTEYFTYTFYMDDVLVEPKFKINNAYCKDYAISLEDISTSNQINKRIWSINNRPLTETKKFVTLDYLNFGVNTMSLYLEDIYLCNAELVQIVDIKNEINNYSLTAINQNNKKIKETAIVCFQESLSIDFEMEYLYCPDNVFFQIHSSNGTKTGVVTLLKDFNNIWKGEILNIVNLLDPGINTITVMVPCFQLQYTHTFDMTLYGKADKETVTIAYHSDLCNELALIASATSQGFNQIVNVGWDVGNNYIPTEKENIYIKDLPVANYTLSIYIEDIDGCFGFTQTTFNNGYIEKPEFLVEHLYILSQAREIDLNQAVLCDNTIAKLNIDLLSGSQVDWIETIINQENDYIPQTIKQVDEKIARSEIDLYQYGLNFGINTLTVKTQYKCVENPFIQIYTFTFHEYNFYVSYQSDQCNNLFELDYYSQPAIDPAAILWQIDQQTFDTPQAIINTLTTGDYEFSIIITDTMGCVKEDSAALNFFDFQKDFKYEIEIKNNNLASALPFQRVCIDNEYTLYLKSNINLQTITLSLDGKPYKQFNNISHSFIDNQYIYALPIIFSSIDLSEHTLEFDVHYSCKLDGISFSKTFIVYDQYPDFQIQYYNCDDTNIGVLIENTVPHSLTQIVYNTWLSNYDKEQIEGKEFFIKREFNGGSLESLPITITVYDQWGCKKSRYTDIEIPKEKTQIFSRFPKDPCLNQDMKFSVEVFCEFLLQENISYHWDVNGKKYTVLNDPNLSIAKEEFIPNSWNRVVLHVPLENLPDIVYTETFYLNDIIDVDFIIEPYNNKYCNNQTISIIDTSKSIGNDLLFVLLQPNSFLPQYEIAARKQNTNFEVFYQKFSDRLFEVYTASMTVFSNNCSATKVKQIKLYNAPEVRLLTPSLAFCNDTSISMVDIYIDHVRFSVNGKSSIYLDGNLLKNYQIAPSSLSQGEHIITYVNETDQCQAVAYLSLNIFPSPYFAFVDESYLDLKIGNLKLHRTKVINKLYTLVWSDNVPEEERYSDAPLVPLNDGEVFHVTLIDENQCSYSDSITIRVLETIEIKNSFTPNNDGINDVFDMSYLKKYYPNAEMKVFSREGIEIYSNNTDLKWDGRTYDGQSVKDVVYFINISLYDSKGTEIKKVVNILSNATQDN